MNTKNLSCWPRSPHLPILYIRSEHTYISRHAQLCVQGLNGMRFDPCYNLIFEHYRRKAHVCCRTNNMAKFTIYSISEQITFVISPTYSRYLLPPLETSVGWLKFPSTYMTFSDTLARGVMVKSHDSYRPTGLPRSRKRLKAYIAHGLTAGRIFSVCIKRMWVASCKFGQRGRE